MTSEPCNADHSGNKKNILLLLTLIGFDWLLLGLIRFGGAFRGETPLPLVRMRRPLALSAMPGTLPRTPGFVGYKVTKLQSSLGYA